MHNETNTVTAEMAPTTPRSSGLITLHIRPMTPWALALAMLWAVPVAAASAATGPSTVATQTWVEHQAPGAELTIHFPDQPTLTYRTTSTFVGEVRSKIWIADSAAGQFTVSHSRLPGLARVLATDNMLYDGARDKLIEEHGGGRVIAEQSPSGLFERDVRYELRDTSGTLVAVGRMLVGNTGDEVIVINGVVIPGQTADLERFFASLNVPADNRS